MPRDEKKRTHLHLCHPTRDRIGGRGWTRCYQGYFTCFNAQQYYEAHDVLEHLWLQRQGRELRIFQRADPGGGRLCASAKAVPPAGSSQRRAAAAAGESGSSGSGREISSLTAPVHLQLDVEALCELCIVLAEAIEASDFQINPWQPANAPQSCTSSPAVSDPAALRAYDVIVVGGGAAGLMCAFEAGKRGRRVAVLEHNERVGKKIAISGGGRCNFTNLKAHAGKLPHGKPRFLQIGPRALHAVGLRRARGKARDPLPREEARAAVLRHQLAGDHRDAPAGMRAGGRGDPHHCRVTEVSKPERFRLETNLGTLEAAALVIATGGLSFPKLGASDFGYRVARQFGLKMTALRPGLVPLTWTEGERSALPR